MMGYFFCHISILFLFLKGGMKNFGDFFPWHLFFYLSFHIKISKLLPWSFVLTSMSAIHHLANNVEEGKQCMNPVTEIICQASYLSLFFPSHNLLVFHADYSDRYLKNKTKNFLIAQINILIF